jgi:SH3 domain-containing YSC84-like protein 1
MRSVISVLLVLSCWAGAVAPAAAQTPLDDSVNDSAKALREIMAVPLKCIPHALLQEAQGIAIVPGMKKAGLIIGMEHGKGVLLTRDPNGMWRAPVFITVTGGSIGLQAGVQTSDLFLVFKTRSGVDRTFKGRVTIGSDLAVAAGPVGRDSLLAGDGSLKVDIVSYSRSHGLFAGFAINGATLHIDNQANMTYYAARPGQPQPCIPASAATLVQLTTSYDPPLPLVVPAAAVAVKELSPPPVVAVPDDRETVRQQLVAAALRLQALLDPTWQKYLALPSEVFTGQSLPAGGSFDGSLQRYRTIANDPRYWTLNEHPEFQETLALLRRYAAFTQPRPAGTLSLPLPPGS